MKVYVVYYYVNFYEEGSSWDIVKMFMDEERAKTFCEWANSGSPSAAEMRKKCAMEKYGYEYEDEDEPEFRYFAYDVE